MQSAVAKGGDQDKAAQLCGKCGQGAEREDEVLGWAARLGSEAAVVRREDMVGGCSSFGWLLVVFGLDPAPALDGIKKTTDARARRSAFR